MSVHKNGAQRFPTGALVNERRFFGLSVLSCCIVLLPGQFVLTPVVSSFPLVLATSMPHPVSLLCETGHTLCTLCRRSRHRLTSGSYLHTRKQKQQSRKQQTNQTKKNIEKTKTTKEQTKRRETTKKLQMNGTQERKSCSNSRFGFMIKGSPTRAMRTHQPQK